MSGRRRILHLTSSAFFGGPERQIVKHAEAMRAGEFEVVIGVIHDGHGGEETVEEARRRGIESVGLLSPGPITPRLPFTLASIVRRRACHLLVSHGYKANVLGSVTGRALGTPHLCYARGWTDENRRIRFYQALDRFVLRRSWRVITVSHGFREVLVREGIAASRIAVVHNAVDLEEIGAVPPKRREDVWAEVGFPPGTSLVAAGGRLSPEKGHAVLLDAWPAVVAACPRAGLLLFGAGPLEQELRRQVSRLGIESSVRLLGHRRDFLSWLAALDVMALPSFSEGLPNVVLEAFARAVPVVASRVGGVPELVLDGETGLLVGPGDAGALARRLLDVLEGRVARETLTARARSLVERAFSFPGQAAKLADIYREALDRRFS